MPGWTFDLGMSGAITVKRPEAYFDPSVYPEWLPLSLTPSRELYRAFDGDLDALARYMREPW